MRVNNKRKYAHQMRAKAYLSTRFLTRVCAKMVRAFCVCVGRLHVSLSCKSVTPNFFAFLVKVDHYLSA